MQDPQAALRVVVSGRVQGVGFRDFVLARARFLGLSGYVRNLPDRRSVEVVAEGPQLDLEELLDHVRRGPTVSRVDDVEVEWGKATGAYEGFGVGFTRP